MLPDDPENQLRALTSPARAVWFDLDDGTERILDSGEPPPPRSGSGFVWGDLEMGSSDDAEGLVRAGLVPAGMIADDGPAHRVRWSARRDCVHLDLVGTRLDGGSLVLDRRHIVVTDGAVASIHRGQPLFFERMRERYADSFALFAKSYGFLLFEMTGLLVDDFHAVVRDLGDHIDDVRIGSGAAPQAATGDAGAELLGATLLVRRVLVSTRDVLLEVATRRSAFVPDTTQPYLRDTASRIDGMLDDLAFSRDVLSEALRTAPAASASAGPTAREGSPRPIPATPGPAGPPYRFTGIGGFGVLRDGTGIQDSAFGIGRAAELLCALLCARGRVRRDTLLGWFWPDLDEERGAHALEATVAQLRRALDAESDGTGQEGPVRSEGGHLWIELRGADAWDVGDLLSAAADTAALGDDPSERVSALSELVLRSSSPLYPDWPRAEWAIEVRQEHARASAALRGSLAEGMLAAGDPSAAVEHFRLLLDETPEQERLHRGIMRCHAAVGERALALRQFHTCRSILRQTQSAEPSPETQALYLALLREAPEAPPA